MYQCSIYISCCHHNMDSTRQLYSSDSCMKGQNRLQEPNVQPPCPRRRRLSGDQHNHTSEYTIKGALLPNCCIVGLVYAKSCPQAAVASCTACCHGPTLIIHQLRQSLSKAAKLTVQDTEVSAGCSPHLRTTASRSNKQVGLIDGCIIVMGTMCKIQTLDDWILPVCF